MEVILLRKINNLGELGDQVKVRPGYGRNYLIPQDKALLATPENMKEFESRRKSLEQEQADALGLTKIRAEHLNTIEITLSRNAREGGKLFGSVTAHDIASAVKEQGGELSPNEVHLPDGSIRSVGEFDVTAHLSTEVDALVKVYIVAREK